VNLSQHPIYAVVPAAGIGKRMGSEIPKQYLKIEGQCIIEYALAPLLAHSSIEQVIVSLSDNDEWFNQLNVASHPKLTTVVGGHERADSVLNALQVLPENGFVMVHDAARPCLTPQDINQLIDNVSQDQGAILGSLVRDTMKRVGDDGHIKSTVSRELLYHALTPQIFVTTQLKTILKEALKQGVNVTDEASAMEWHGIRIKMIEGRSDNIKVTRPEDLQLAQLYLQEQRRHAQHNKKIGK